MLYGVFSDSHDNYYNLERAVKVIKDRGVTTCFHLGDFCAPGFVRAMIAHEDINWVCVWGNVDGAKAKIILEQCATANFDISPEAFREYSTPDGTVFLTHFPILARNAALSGEYKAVFHGHNHIKKVESLDNGTLLANPGELAGFKTGQPSIGVYDSEQNDLEIIDLSDFRVAR